jgi:hypothetical protein
MAIIPCLSAGFLRLTYLYPQTKFYRHHPLSNGYGKISAAKAGVEIR